ncbi:type II secretion system F family protein [Demequina aurantiaca]|uniref:type II secretion system F family protein n=1 Tax=Demequina aurantiaca TaxID=676200 RepID=UPI003D353725
MRDPGAAALGHADPPIVLAAVVGLLRSGMSTSAAWRSVGVLSVAEDGTPDVPWNAQVTLAVGAACRLSHRTGAPLATVLDAVSDHVEATLEADSRREAAAAGPRLSARVLTFLPLVGLGLGAVVDAGVVRVVATTPIGWFLLAAAGGLTLLGRAWMRRMMRTAEEASREP